jgi:hypothetical protein
MEKVNLTKMLFLVTIFKQNMNIFEVYNGGQCVMVLIKNVTTTSKGDCYSGAQHYLILKGLLMKLFNITFFNYTTNYQMFNLHSKK